MQPHVCTITSDQKSNKCNYPLDHRIVQQSCQGSTRTLTFLITFNDQFFRAFGDEPVQIVYNIQHNMTKTNFTAHVYFEPQQKVESTESSAVTSNPGPLTTATTVITEKEHSLCKIKTDCACNSSLNSMYVSNSVLLLSTVILVIHEH